MYAIGDTFWPGTSKLIEEMGELNQCLGKLMGLSKNAPDQFYKHWDGTNIKTRIEEEVADVIAAIIFFVISNDLDIDDGRIDHKISLFKEWHSDGSARS